MKPFTLLISLFLFAHVYGQTAINGVPNQTISGNTINGVPTQSVSGNTINGVPNQSVGGGSPTVNLSCYEGSSSLTHTISGINDVGVNAIYVAVTSFNTATGGIGTVTVTHSADASTSTYITPFSDGNSPSSQFFYWLSPATSATDSFLVTGASPGLYDTTCIFLVTGVTGATSGANNNVTAGSTCTTSSCQAGSLTPSGSGYQVVMVCFGSYQATGAPTIDSFYTGLQYNDGAGGTAYGEYCAYLMQSSGSATNPTGTLTNTATTPTGIIAAVH